VLQAFPEADWGLFQHLKPVEIIVPAPKSRKVGPSKPKIFTQEEVSHFKKGYDSERGFVYRNSKGIFEKPFFLRGEEEKEVKFKPINSRRQKKVRSELRELRRYSCEDFVLFKDGVEVPFEGLKVSESSPKRTIPRVEAGEPSPDVQELAESFTPQQIEEAQAELKAIFEGKPFEDFKQGMGGILGIPQITPEQIERITNSLEKLVGEGVNVNITQPTCHIISQGISFVLVLYLMCTETSWSRISLLLTAYFMSLGVSTILFMKIWEFVKPVWSSFIAWVSSFGKDKDGYEVYPKHLRQSEELNFISPIVSALSSLLVTSFLKDDKRNLPHIVKVGNIASAFNSVKTLTQGMSVIVNSTIDAVKTYVVGSPNHEKDIEKFENWRTCIVNTVYNADWIRSIYNDRSKIVELHDLENQGRDLLIEFKNNSASFKTPLMDLMKDLRRHREALEALFNHKTTAPEPVFVVFCAKTGVGKTASVDRLMNDLLLRLPIDRAKRVESHQDISWTKQSTSDYMEGYHGQPFVLLDEMFQSCQKEDLAAEAKNVFDMINSHNMPMNMAAAELKGKIYFVSEFVFGTTNRKNWSVDIPIKEHQALLRRRDFFLEPEVKPEFRVAGSHMLDPNKWVSHCIKEKIDSTIPDYCNYVILPDNGTADNTCERITYSELLNRVNQLAEIKRAKFMKRSEEISKLFLQHLERVHANLKQSDDSDDEVFKDCYSVFPEEAEFIRTGTIVDFDISMLIEGPVQNMFGVDEEFLTPREKWLFCFLYNLYYDNRNPAKMRETIVAHLPKITYYKIVMMPWAEFKKIKEKLPVGIDMSIWNKVKLTIKKHQSFILWCTLTLAAFSLLGALLWTPLPEVTVKHVHSKSEGKAYDKGVGKRISGLKWRVRKEGEEVDPVIYNGMDVEIEIEPGGQVEDMKQACADAQVEPLIGILSSQVVHCEVLGIGDTVITNSRGIIIAQGFLLVNKHLLFRHTDFMKDALEMRITRSGRISVSVPIDLIRENMTSIGDRWSYDDVLLLYLKDFVQGRNIVKYFLKKDEICDLTDGQGELVVPRGTVITRYVSTFRSTDLAIRTGNYRLDVDKGLRAVKGYHYDSPTRNGDCGSPLLRWDSKATTKIVGIHAAGGLKEKSGGFATIVDQEWLMKTMTAYSPLVRQSDDKELLPYTGRMDLVDTPIVVVGLVPPGERVKLPTKPSCYVPSVFQKVDLFPVTTATTDCSYYGEGNKLFSGFAKFTPSTRALDQRRIDKIKKWIFYQFFSSSDRQFEVLDWEQALNVYDQINSINLNSSMGYPWVLSGEKKKSFIDYDEDNQKYVFNKTKGQELLTRLNKYDDMIKKGEVPTIVQLCYLKDERLPLGKILDGKCRVFMGCPIEATLLFRKYFGSFVNFIGKTKMKHGIMLNINPYEEWNEMTIKLLEKNQHVVCLDYKSFDRTIPPQLLSMFFRVADMYYGGRSQIERDCIECFITKPLLQVKNIRFEVSTLNSSGNPATGVINSFANLAKTIYALCDQVSFDIATEKSFSAYCGDDEISSFDFDLDLEKYVDSIKNMGFKPTSAQKDCCIKSVPIEEAQFLKRGFYEENGVWYGPLDLDTIKESLLWQKRGNNPEIAMEETLRCAFLELSLHPFKLVSDCVKRIVQMATIMGIEITFTEAVVDMLESSSNLYDWTFKAKGGLIETGLLLAVPRAKWSIMETHGEKFEPQVGKIYRLLVTKVDVSLLMGVGEGLAHAGFTEVFGSEPNRILGKHITFSSRGVITTDHFCGQPVVENSYIKHSQEFSIIFDVYEHLNINEYNQYENNCLVWLDQVMRDNFYECYLYEQFRLFMGKYYDNHMRTSLFSRYQDTFPSTIDIIDFKQSDTPLESVVEDNSAKEEVSFDNISEMGYEGSGGPVRNIRSLLASSAKIFEFNWSTAHAQDALLAEIKFPDVLFDCPQFMKKIEFNQLLKFDIDIEFLCVAPPFDMGKAVIVWVPLMELGWPGGQEINALGLTGMIHVSLEPGKLNSARMTIPFTHIKNFICPRRRGDKMNSLGSIIVKVINPYSTETSVQDIAVTVMANFDNVKLSVPTPLTRESVWEEQVETFPRYSRKQSDEAKAKSEQGIVTGVTNMLGGVVRLIAGIPVFKPIISGVSAVAHVTGGITQALGLSKPASLAATMPTIVRPFSGVSFREGLDMSIPLGTSPSNHVAIQPGHFGSLVDEMSIRYLVKTPSMIATRQWETGKTSGMTIANFAVHPFIGTGMKAGSRQAVQMSYMGYVASSFYYWRGTIQFCVEIVRTQYHAGILLIGFIPGGTVNKTVAFDLETTSHVRFDLSSSDSSVKFSVPFVSTQVYNKVGAPFDQIDLDKDVATGTLVIKVLNPLKAPDTVNQFVFVNIWASGGDDMEFALPTLHGIRTFGYGYKEIIQEFNNSFDESDLDDDYNLRQVEDFTREKWQFQDHAEPLRGLTHADPDFSVRGFKDIVMGEDIRSLRDVLKMSCQKWSVVTKVANIETTIPVHSLLQEGSKLDDTYYDHFIRLFRYSRGTIRHKIVVSEFPGTLSASIATLVGTKEYAWTKSIEPCNSPWAICVPDLNQTLEYAIPFFSTHKNEVHGKKSSTRSVRLKIDLFDVEEYNKDIEMVVYESVGDDFSAGYLMGVPVIFERSHTVASFIEVLLGIEKLNIRKSQPADSSQYPVERWKPSDKISIGNVQVQPILNRIWYWQWLWTNNRSVWVADLNVEGFKFVELFKVEKTLGIPDRDLIFLQVPRPNPTYTTTGCTMDVSNTRTFLQGLWIHLAIRPDNIVCNLIDSGSVGTMPSAVYVGPGDITPFLNSLVSDTISGVVEYTYA